jgi:hypothetical protein
MIKSDENTIPEGSIFHLRSPKVCSLFRRNNCRSDRHNHGTLRSMIPDREPRGQRSSKII